MAHLDVRVFIRASPERVWAIIADFPSQPRWMVDVRSLEVTSESKQGPGTVIEIVSELFGLPAVKDHMQVTSWQPPHRYEVSHSSPLFSGTGLFQVDPVPGGVVLAWIEDFEPLLGPLGNVGYSLFVAPQLQRTFGRSLDKLRQLAEGESAWSGAGVSTAG